MGDAEPTLPPTRVDGAIQLPRPPIEGPEGDADRSGRWDYAFRRRETGMTKRMDVKRSEKAAILLSTRPLARPAF